MTKQNHQVNGPANSILSLPHPGAHIQLHHLGSQVTDFNLSIVFLKEEMS